MVYNQRMSGPKRYGLGAEIGRGALGRVVRVHRPGQPDLAGKILHASQQADPRSVARFEGEAALLAGLRHPNIVAVHGLEEIDGERVLVMELVDGMSLARAIAVEGTLSETRATAIGRGIAAGLAAAHHAGLVHRDLKPDNVLLAPGDLPKLVDFGLARATSFAGVDPGAFAIVGTPDYMAPETVDPIAVDVRADLYSLGCILYEMITGAPPYTGATGFAVLEAHRTADLPELPPDRCSPGLADLIRSLLAKSPADRPQSAAAVADNLAALSSGRALVPRSGFAVVHSGRCAACGEPAVLDVPVCFGCGMRQLRVEPGRFTVFVTGPGETTHKLDAALRDRLLDWLRSNPGVGLAPDARIAKARPRLPFVVASGVSERSAEVLVASLAELGLRAELLLGGRFALPTMRKKAWRLGGRILLIGATGLYWGVQGLGMVLLPVLGAGAAGALAAGWIVAGREAARRSGEVAASLPDALAEPLGRISGAVSAMREQRHRESLRGVVQRALAMHDRLPAGDREAIDADLGRVLDLALVATTRIDELEAALADVDLRDPSAEARAWMLERDSWAARLLELTAFLDALRAEYAAAGVAEARQTREQLDELRAHIEALEEVQAL